MRKPLVSNDNFRMCSQSTLYPPILPIPEHHVPVRISTADPSPVRREPDLACVSCNGVSCEPLLSVLSEVIGGVDEDLIVERLRSEPFLYQRRTATLDQYTVRLARDSDQAYYLGEE